MRVDLAGSKPWLPCRTTAACLAAMWGGDEQAWVGHRVQLYHDPSVRVGSEVVGGIRVRGGDIPRAITATIKLARRSAFKVRLAPISAPVSAPVSAPASPPTAETPILESLLAAAGLTLADLDAARVVAGKPRVADLTDEQRAVLAAYYATHPEAIASIRRPA
jgi:hypothetical protein